MFDGGPAVAEDLGDADLVQGDIGWAEGGEAVVGVAAQAGCGGLCLCDGVVVELDYVLC